MNELKTRKAISSSIAAILIATISITLLGTTYFFSQGVLKGTTAEAFEVIDVFSNKIIVRNIGTQKINNFTVLVDGKGINAKIEQPVDPGSIGTVVLNLTDVSSGRHELVIMSKSMSQRWTWEFQYVSETTTTTTIVETTTPAPETTTTLPVGEAGTKSSIESVSETEQGSAEIGKPVKWKSRIQLKNPSPVDIENYPISSFLPRDANDVVVKTKWWIFSREIGTMVNVAGFGSVSLSVEYQTPVPYKEETVNTTEVWKKSVKVKSDASVHYKNVKVYSKVSEDIINPRIYFVENNTRKDITSDPYYKVSFIDTDGNGKVDTIFWVVPELSEKLFDIMGGSTWLDVNLLTPNPSECNETSPCSWKQYTNNWVNASVTCSGGDCGTVQGLARYKISNTYDFKGITNPSSTHWTGSNRTYGMSGTIPVPDNYTQASTENYQQINSSDDNLWFFSASWKSAQFETVAPVQMFKFKLNESLKDIEKMFILWEGHGVGGFVNDVQLYLWSLSSSSWVYINSTPLDAEGEYNLTYILNSSFSDFVDSSNYIRIAAKGPNANYNQQTNGELYTDYLKVDISSWKAINTIVDATPFYTTDSNPKSCGSLSSGQSCQLNWTINTTGTVNSINKIDVKFNSSISENLENDTKDAFIIITWLNQPPQWSQNSAFPLSGQFYQSGRNYGFQIKWTDPELGVTGISSVIFEWGNGTTKYNYTKPLVNNDTNGVYWFNLTDFAAGNYNFTWYANDTSNVWTKSDTWPYTINKASATIHLFLNGTEMDKEYINNTAANFTVTLDIPSKTVYLNTNITGWNIQNSTTPLINITVLTASVFGTKYNITGYFLEDQNYSANSTIHYVIIQNPLTVYGWLNVTMTNPNPSIYNTTNPKTDLQNDSFIINATVRCEGNTSAVCGNVMGSARYNSNIISTDPISKPFYIILINAKTDTVYPNTTNKAWKNLAPTKVGAASDNDTEFITSEYNDIKLSNNSWVKVYPNTNNYGGLHFSFGLGNYQNINKIKFTFEGYVAYETIIDGPGNTSGELYIYTDGGWTYNGTCGNEYGDQTCAIEINSNTDYYLDNNNKFHFGFVAPWKLGTGMIYTDARGDFVKLEVTYGGTQNPSPCGSLSKGDTCNLNWTVNATGLEGNPNIWNIDVNASSDKKSYGVNDNDTNDATVKINETEKPRWVENTNSTSSTYAGTPTKFILKWIDNFALSGYMLSLDNCTGSFKNESWSNSGWESYPSEGWSNVTRIINSTTDCTIRWRYFANDTTNNWNVSQNFSFNTTGVVPWLNVTLLTPNTSECSEGRPCSWRLYNTYKINAIVECKDGDCGDVNGTARYNTTDGMVPINTTEEATPFYAFYSFNDSFEGNAVGSNPLDWEIIEFENGSVNVVDTLFANGLKSVELNDTDPISFQGKVQMKKNIPRLKNGIWEWYVNVNQTDPYILMFLGGAVDIHLYSGGEIKAFNGSNEQIIGTYSNNKWYKFKVKFDSKTQKFSIWINDSLNASNFDFEKYSEYVNSIQYWGTFSSGIAKFYVDEVKIEGLLANNTQLCGNMKKNQLCQLEWIVNATGTTDSVYKIGVLFNSSYSSVKQNHTNNATVKILSGNLDVNLNYPPIGTTNVYQNTVFNVNATVTCRNAPCGNVYGTVRYNASSVNPDTAINTTTGATPFYMSWQYKNLSTAVSACKPLANQSEPRVGFCSVPTWNYTPQKLCIDFISTNASLDGDLADGSGGYRYYPDGKVDGSDLNGVSMHLNTKCGNSNYDQMADVDNNCTVDNADVIILSRNWGKDGSYTYTLTGVYVAFDTGENKTLDNENCTWIPFNAKNFTVYNSTNQKVGAMVLFYSPKNTISCGSMSEGDVCQLNWTVNAIGAINSYWKIGVLFNSSIPSVKQNHTNNATVKISGGNLEVNLTYPPIGTTNVNQNTVFNVNATVNCRNAPCGNVYGTVRYNASSANPDTAINTTVEATPFYISKPKTFKIYNFSGITRPSTTHRADNGTGILANPDVVGTEATSANYNSLNSRNDQWWETITYGDISYQKYRFKLNEPSSTINNLTVLWEGKGRVSTSWYVILNIWNFDTLEWDMVYSYYNSSWDDNDHILSKSYTSSINRYVNASGYLFMYVKTLHPGAESYSFLWSDFVKVEVNATLNPNSCGPLSKDQSCQLNWTVNATGVLWREYKVGVLFNSSYNTITPNHTNNATVKITRTFLDVNLTYPPIGTTNVYQNNIFTVNASVTCRYGKCGDVNGIVGYNDSSVTPDTPITVTNGATPFYIISALVRPIGYDGIFEEPATEAYDDGFNDSLTDAVVFNNKRGNYTYYFGPSTSAIIFARAAGSTDTGEKIQVYNFTGGTWYDISGELGETIATFSTKVNKSSGLINSTGHAILSMVADGLCYVQLTDTYASFNSNTVYCDGLNENKNCNLTWIVNATGTTDSVYKIGVLFNSSNPSVKQNHTNNATVRISGGNLEVNLTYPPIGTTNVYQNNVFNVNATVNCRNAPCGNVYGTVRYNASSVNPDTAINTTKGDTPFYITEPMWTNKLYNANRSFRNNSAITRGISGYNGMTLNEYINWINNSVKTEVSDLNLTGSQNINYSLTISPAVSYIKLSFALATTQDYYRNWEYAMYNLSIYNYSSASWSSVENRTVTFLGQYSIKEASCRVSNFTIPITSHVKQGNIVNISLYMFEKDYSEHNAGMGPLDVYCDGEHVTFLYFYTAFVWSRLYEGYNNTIPCDSLSKDQSCQLNWTVNATGDLGKGYKVGVLFNSSYSSVKQNHTNNATVKIKMMRELNVTSVNFNDTSFYIYDPIECAGNVIDESHDVTHVYYKIWDHLSSENNPKYSGELDLGYDCVGSSWANGKNCKKIVSSIVGLKGNWYCSIIANDGGNNVTGYAPTATMLNTQPPEPVITQPANNTWFNKYQNPIHITCTNTTPDENIEDSLKFDTIWCCDDIGRDRYACNDNVDTDCVWNLDGDPKVNDNESIRIYCQANDSSDPSDYSDIKIVKLDRTSPNCALNITNITINPYLLKGNYWDALSGMNNVTYWFNNGTWNNIGTNTTANYTWYWNVSNVTPNLENKWIYVKATCNDTAGNDNTSQTYVAVDLINIIPSIWNLKVRDDIDDPINESWSDRMVNITVNVSDPDPVWGINYIGLNFTDLFKGNNYYGNFSLAELGHDYNYYLNFTIKYYYGPGPVWINATALDNNGSSSKTTTSNFTILKTKNFGLENYPIDFNRSKPLQFVNATMNRGWPLKIYSRSNWPMNFSQNGTNLTGIQDNAFLIRISKVLWNLTDSGTFSPFKEGTPSSIINNVGVGENVSVYYKLDVPLTKPQNYSGEITIEGLLV